MNAKPHTYSLIHHCLVNELILWLAGSALLCMLFSAETTWSFFIGGLIYCFSQTAAGFYAFRFHRSSDYNLIWKNFLLGQILKYALYVMLLISSYQIHPFIWSITLSTYLIMTLFRPIWLTRKGLYHGNP